MENRLDTEFGNLAISEGFATPEQVYICQLVVDTFEEENRKSIEVIMKDRGYITSEQETYLFKKMGVTIVLCPHCNKRIKKANDDLQKIIDCKHCGKRFEHEASCQSDTQQTSLTSNKTLAAFQLQQTCDRHIGKLLGGKYEIIEKIAVGGWSTIYKAKRRLLNIDDIVAVKILHINLSDNPHDIKRFYNEAATIRELRHPNAIHLYDFDRDANGTIYMAMEFIHGNNLKETIKNNGTFDVSRMLNIIFQVCDVISTAHKHPRKIIHRDITPQNIMLSRVGEVDDFVKVLDFGIAKLRTHDNISLTGSIVGTPLYMAPEQWRGECDERTDIYSLGVIMYEMLAGETPFRGDQITLMNKHLNEKPQSFRKLHKNLKIPKYLENIIFCCLEKNKNKRPQSIDELKSLLQRGKCSTKLQLAHYSKNNLLIIIPTILSIPLVLYVFFFPEEYKKTTTIPRKSVHIPDSFRETNRAQKNDNTKRQKTRDNNLEAFLGEEPGKNKRSQDSASNKISIKPPHPIDSGNLDHIADEKKTANYHYLDTAVDNIQKYGIYTSTKEAVTKPEPKEIVKREIRSWLQEYKKAWEKGDIETLKEIGHISSEKEESKLRQHYQYVHDVKVFIQNEIIEINDDNSQATVSFDRTDAWTDERGNRHKRVLPRITKILRNENNIWKIIKKTDELEKQTPIYKNILDNITTKYDYLRNNLTITYDLLREQINNRFTK
ncbi:MAG: serine/threonine protein kinase [Candidatus Brocadia sp.]|nr:serine/threonine protein kinase [Candidatus Brocadia sp.]